MTLDATAKAGILVDALPYIRRFRGQIVVVKYGGNALDRGLAKATAAPGNGDGDGNRPPPAPAPRHGRKPPSPPSPRTSS